MFRLLNMCLLFVVLSIATCAKRKPIDSEAKGNDTGNYFFNADSLIRDPKIFLEARAQSGRPVPACNDIPSFNQTQLHELNEMNTTADSPAMAGDQSRKETMSLAEAQELYRRIVNHPVVDLKYTSKYDPKNDGLGFCFGRAMAVHLEALFKMNLKNSSIRKLFAVGNLSKESFGINWGWHVTAIVKAAEGGWWAIDNKIGPVMKAEDWYKTMLKYYNPSKDLVLFHDRAMRFTAAEPRYTVGQINFENYNNYFKDLLDVYKQQFRTDGSSCPLPRD